MLKAKILSYGKPYFWSTLSHERLVTAFVVFRRVPSFSRRAALVPSLIFDKTYLFYRIKYSPGLYFSCAVLVFTKHTCFIVWRAHFFDGAEKCSKHMCFIGQDAKMLIFLLRGAFFERLWKGCFCVCAVHFQSTNAPMVCARCTFLTQPPLLWETFLQPLHLA